MRTAIAMRPGWIGAGLLLALAACHDDKPTKCGEGTELVARECVPLGPAAGGGGSSGPSGDAGLVSCGEDTYVVDGRCEALKPIGAACRSGLECDSGGCLSESRGAVGGYCTIAGCSENRPCPAGSHCTFSERDQMTLCLAYCDEDQDCRAGDYACQPLYTIDVHVCAPSCAISDACPSGTLCDPSSGKCTIHECELGDEDACGGEDSGLTCFPDRRGLGTSGAICLTLCDPKNPSAVCSMSEVCQPLPDDPESVGFCAPPVCTTSEVCPVGSLCRNDVCQPPARCDDDGECADEDAVCVGGAGGQCMPACEDEDACKALQSGLSCATSLGACLPTGSFPGGACRNVLDAPCDTLSVVRGDESTTLTPMLCASGTCVASCADGGSALCSDLDATLGCADGVLDVPVCLPQGSFPGGPCDASDECAPLARGGASLAMTCESDKCLILCDDAAGGDLLCEGVDASLVCVADLFSDDVCLPRGSIPGGPCAAGNTCDEGLVCEDDKCLYDCTTGGQALCAAVSSTLACATGIFATPVCLPKGSFPGGPCATGDVCDGDPMLVCVPGATPTCAPGCMVPAATSEYCLVVGATLGTGYDACADADPTGGTLLLCVDGTP